MSNVHYKRLYQLYRYLVVVTCRIIQNTYIVTTGQTVMGSSKHYYIATSIPRDGVRVGIDGRAYSKRYRKRVWAHCKDLESSESI